MINFEEELKNFTPILELSDIEEDINENNITDIIDLLKDLRS